MSQTCQRSVSILIVDDDPASRKLLSVAVGRASLDCTKVEVAGSIEQTVEKLRIDSFDVVLLDLNLPGSYGRETIQTVAEAQPTAAIVIVSGLDEEDMDMLEIGEQAQGRISKGKFDVAALEETIAEAVEKKASQRHMNGLTP